MTLALQRYLRKNMRATGGSKKVTRITQITLSLDDEDTQRHLWDNKFMELLKK
jgi:hypothetical protein